MLRKIALSLPVMVVVAVFICTSARADGDARPAREMEKNFYSRVMQTFENALPDGPDGWELTRQSEINLPEWISVGAENLDPMSLTYEKSWQDTVEKEKAQARLEAVISQSAGQQAPTVSEAELLKRGEVLSAALAEAAQKGDMAGVERLQKEFDALAVQLEGVYAPREDHIRSIIGENEPHDVNFSISLTCNNPAAEFYGPYTREEPMAGAPVYRTEGKSDPNRGWQEGTTYVFLGNWKLIDNDGTARMEAEPMEGKNYLSVQTIVARVQAEKNRARDAIEKIDWSALKALLEK